MYGVGRTLAGLSDFVGGRLETVDDLGNIVYFRFVGTGESQLAIGVESDWVIQDASGAVVTSGQPRPTGRTPSPPVGTCVVAAETRPPNAIELRFLSGHTLCVIDNSDQYESFCIPHANVYV